MKTEFKLHLIVGRHVVNNPFVMERIPDEISWDYLSDGTMEFWGPTKDIEDLKNFLEDSYVPR